MTKFEVVSVQGGYIVRYWVSKDCKTKCEVYPTAEDLRERLNRLIQEMDEE